MNNFVSSDSPTGRFLFAWQFRSRAPQSIAAASTRSIEKFLALPSRLAVPCHQLLGVDAKIRCAAISAPGTFVSPKIGQSAAKRRSTISIKNPKRRRCWPYSRSTARKRKLYSWPQPGTISKRREFGVRQPVHCWILALDKCQRDMGVTGTALIDHSRQARSSTA